ncbi:MAG: type II toxin-antitoxin system Phd/YefM family antitoxin [Prevotella sp.]|nr:type II toxin-antitoxin system Phd/YefM family antitoxin [Prevotella sp.]
MRTANYSELRANMKHYLDGVIKDNEPLIVHRQGAESVVVISLDDYNAMVETEYLMKSPAMMRAIQKGEDDIKNGRSVTKREDETMEEFLARCTR